MMRRTLLCLGFAALTFGCGFNIPENDPTADRFTGPEAKKLVTSKFVVSNRLPHSANHFYLYDGGTFNGSIVYVSFDCANREDCWTAVEALGSPDHLKFKTWSQSHFAVVMDGPGFYHSELKDDPWDVRGIEDGVVYEETDADHRRMTYYAIDYNRKRVYYHRESGGFPADSYKSQNL
jgi:hypothetical protein